GGGFRDLAERIPGARIDRVDIAAGFRLVPGAAVIGTAIFRQHDGLRGGGLRGDGGGHVALPMLAKRGCQVRLMVSSPPRRPIAMLAPIASTNRTISMAYMRGMSNTL